MNQNQVVDLMQSSNSEKEWNDNCDKVKKACDGYPSFWYATIIMSGLLSIVSRRWDKNTSLAV